MLKNCKTLFTDEQSVDNYFKIIKFSDYKMHQNVWILI